MSTLRQLAEYPGVQIGRDGTIIGRSGQRITASAGRYISVPVRVNGRSTTVGAHVLVALAWIGPQPDGHEVAHRNGNTHDNRAANLRWATPAENSADRIEHGTQARGVAHGRARLTEDAVRVIRSSDESARALARRFGVDRRAVEFVRAGKTWRHVA